MNLFIVESPNKCGKLKGYLGSNFNVTASVGHIREIPKKGLNIDIANNFEPTYKVIDGKQAVVKEIKKLAKTSDKIYIATDPDREGEAISQHIFDILDAASQKKCVRITFNEITKKAVLEAVDNPRTIDTDLVHAQKARQILDRLIGYKVSPVLWYDAHIPASSAGRVQSIALKIVCDRQKEIDAFKSTDFWYIDAILKCKNGKFTARVITQDKDNKYIDEKLSKEEYEKLKVANYKLGKIDKTERQNKPNPPFDTNSLQTTCASTFGWSLNKSKMIAQKLYEAGKVSYIRSDSFAISEEALKEVRDLITQATGDEKNKYLPSKPNVYTKKSSAATQEAHECIRPTHCFEKGDDIDDADQRKMYKLIRDRFIACQMMPQIVSATTYHVDASTGNKLIAKGQTVKFDGWTKVYKYTKSKEEILPEADEGEKLDLDDISRHKHSTKPPAHFNEGSLSKKMEDDGIGRPSTRDSIITSIQKKGYVEREQYKPKDADDENDDVEEEEEKPAKGKKYGKKSGKGLVPTELGKRIYDYLQPNFQDFFMDLKYTSNIENELDEIANGKKDYLDVLNAFYSNLTKHIKGAQSDPNNSREPVSTGKKCIVCNEGEIVLKKGRYGEFLSCTKYPACKTIYKETEDGEYVVKQKAEVKKTGKKCPECEKNKRDGELVERKNKSTGEIFYGCSAYPKCKYSAKTLSE